MAKTDFSLRVDAGILGDASRRGLVVAMETTSFSLEHFRSERLFVEDAPEPSNIGDTVWTLLNSGGRLLTRICRNEGGYRLLYSHSEPLDDGGVGWLKAVSLFEAAPASAPTQLHTIETSPPSQVSVVSGFSGELRLVFSSDVSIDYIGRSMMQVIPFMSDGTKIIVQCTAISATDNLLAFDRLRDLASRNRLVEEADYRRIVFRRLFDAVKLSESLSPVSLSINLLAAELTASRRVSIADQTPKVDFDIHRLANVISKFLEADYPDANLRALIALYVLIEQNSSGLDEDSALHLTEMIKSLQYWKKFSRQEILSAFLDLHRISRQGDGAIPRPSLLLFLDWVSALES